MQPVRPTTSPGRSRRAAQSMPSLPIAFSSAFSRTEQELTRTTSASSSDAASEKPAARSRRARRSESRTFIWQP